MNESINLLVLDEPTNHLDIDSREWIESALEDYEEALLFVSHDRYFIDRFATRIWALEDGTINDYPCDFEAYRKLKDQLLKKEQRKKEQKRKAKTRTARPQKEAVSIEKQILAIEEKQKELALLIEENATDYIALSELFDERERLESELLTLYDSWEEQVNA